MTFARTGSADFPLHLKVMISGPPKSGKTSLLGTVPNVVIADTEPHANNLMSLAHLDVPFKTINSTNDLRELHMILSNESLRKQAAAAMGMPDIEAVAIDTLDTLQGLMKKERLREKRSTDFLRDDWGWLKTEMEAIIQAFLALPMHVFLIVHTKTKDIGSEKNPRSVVLPGLEGSIAESVAGMVGYSLLSFRKQEINPANGQPYTKYWLRAEGDDTYEFVGNRAAGQLPPVIEPDFKTLLDVAKAGKARAQSEASNRPPVEVATEPQLALQTTAQIAEAPAAPQAPAQNPGQSEPAQQAADAKPADDSPITAAAIQHVSKLFETVGVSFSQDLLEGWSVGQARELVVTYQAIQKDHSEGKGEGDSPQAQMASYLESLGLVSTAPPPAEKPPVEPDIRGTIEQVMAYVDNDLTRAQEAYEMEQGRLPQPRSGVIDRLVAMGVKVPTPVETPQEAVTPETPTADEKSAEEQAVSVIEEAMGPVEVVSYEINKDAKCEKCGNQVDDLDLAKLGKQRFNLILCVEDYLTEAKQH